MIFETRQHMIASLPKGLDCAEFGVFAGEFARDIYYIMQPDLLFLIDLYAGDFTSGDQNGENQRTVHMPDMERHLRAISPGNVLIQRSESVSWLKARNDKILDFIYIDTTHSYEQTKAEIREAWRVVRSGGWIAGHDYHGRFPGVMQAVNELGRPVDLTKDGLPSWMVQKPRMV